MSQTVTDRVADAPTNNWVYRLLPRAVWPYAQLARWDRPIGWWLLLWPCWWSLALTLVVARDRIVEGTVSAGILAGGTGTALAIFLLAMLLFMAGAIAMRGAGCTYNDIVDADFDAKVARTASRPIPSGRVSKRQAALFMVGQALAGFAVLLALCSLSDGFNWFAFWTAIASLLIVAAYPFAKRVTDWPQFVLGLAFSWGALMGWAVVFRELPAAAFLLYAGCILWTVGYDTIYALQDKDDDALIGVRSTARLFGSRTRPALAILYFMALALFALAAWRSGTSVLAYVGLALGAVHMIWQIGVLDIDDAGQCLKLFRSNKIFGWIVFAGFLASAL